MNKLICLAKEIRDYYTIKSSGLFLTPYYLANNTDVLHADIDPIKHFLKNGGFEGRNPSPYFNTQFYLNQYPDVKISGMNPLVHYLKFGKTEKRYIIPDAINETDTVGWHIIKLKLENLESVPKNVDQSRRSTDLHLIKNSIYFDPDIYLKVNPDVKAAGIDPAEHYLYHGWKEGRIFGNKFDSHFYLKCHPEIKDSGMCPLLHYLKNGNEESKLFKPFVIHEEKYMNEADISTIRNDLVINNGLKIAVFCHVFNSEHANELFSYIRNIPIDCNLYFSTSEYHADRLKEVVLSELPGTPFTIMIAQNSGRDIAPFIMALKTQLHSYDLVCKIHTNMVEYDKYLLFCKKYTLDNLLGNPSIINEIFKNFEQHSNLGIVYPLTFPNISHSGFGKERGHTLNKEKNRLLAKAYFPELEMATLPDDIPFPVGSMFWFRPQALEILNTKQFNFDDFIEDNNHIDATLAHIIERFFNVIIRNAGYVSKTTFFSSINISPMAAGFSISEYFSRKILFIAHSLSIAGAENLLFNILNWFAQNTTIKFYVVAITRGIDGGKLLTEYQKLAEVFIWEDMLQNNSETESGKLLFEIIGNVDLIYGNTVIAARLYPFLTIFDAPVLTHIHELEESIQRCTTSAEREAFRSQSSRFIACSGPVKENLIMNHAIHESKIDIIYEFIKTENQFLTDTKRQRERFGLNANSTIIWGCGTIYWRKGVDLFIQTAIKLRDMGGQNFKFYWIGGNYWNLEENEWGSWERLEKIIDENGINDQVIFLGEQDNPKDYMKAGDIFYLPSREDPFPLVCLEAAECELPVICFEKAGGMPDFIEKDAGIVVPYLDTDAAAEAIHFLMTHDSKRKELGQYARKKLLLRHSDSIGVPEILSVCSKVMEQKM
jgi:glycosyltransferase involved in cell wall biosynthesis